MTMHEITVVLQAFANGCKPSPSATKWLYQHGYVEAADVITLDSSEQELLATFITEKGRRLLLCEHRS